MAKRLLDPKQTQKQVQNEDLDSFGIMVGLQSIDTVSDKDMQRFYDANIDAVRRGMSWDIMSDGSRREQIDYMRHVFAAGMFGRTLTDRDNVSRPVPDFDEKGNIVMVQTEPVSAMQKQTPKLSRGEAAFQKYGHIIDSNDRTCESDESYEM